MQFNCLSYINSLKTTQEWYKLSLEAYVNSDDFEKDMDRMQLTTNLSFVNSCKAVIQSKLSELEINN